MSEDSQGVYLVSKPGHEIPATVQALLLEKCPISFTVTTMNEGKMHIDRCDGDDLDLTATLKNMSAANKDKWSIYYFARTTQSEDEIQPFVIVAESGDPKLAVWVDGAPTMYATEEALLAPEAEFVMNFLADKISSMYMTNGKDIKKLMAMLTTASFQSELEPHMEPRTAMIVFANNDIHYIANGNDVLGEFAWGTMSDALGHKEAPPPAPPPGPSGGKPLTDKEVEDWVEMITPYKAKQEMRKQPAEAKRAAAEKALGMSPVTATGTQKGDEAVVDAAMSKSRPDQPTDKGVIAYSRRVILPPKNYGGRGLDKWVASHHMDGDKATKSFDREKGIPFDKLSPASHFLRTINSVDRPTPAKRDPDAPLSERKDTTAHTVPDTLTGHGAVVGVLLQSPDELKRLVVLRKSILGTPIEAAQITAVSKPEASFTERLGDDVTLDEILVWPDAAKYEIAKDKTSAFLLIKQLAARVLNDNPNIIKNIQAAASKAAAGTKVDPMTLPYKERKALERQLAAASS